MEIIVRTSAIFWFLWLVARGLGKRELSELSPFELILIITVGDLVQSAAVQDDTSITGAFIAISTLTFWILMLSVLTFRSNRAAKFLDGVPVVVIRNGEPVESMLQIERLKLSDLKEAARNQGIRDVGEIEYGVLEIDGTFSFVRRPGEPSPQQHQPG